MKKQESSEKTFKAPGGLIFPIIGITSIIGLLTSLSEWEIASTLVFIAVASIVYFVMKWIKKRHKESKHSI